MDEKRMEKLIREAQKKTINGQPVEIKFSSTGRMRCTAKSKQTGFQCKNWAEPGQKVCRYHGGKSRKRTEEEKEYLKGNTHRLTHGLYSNQLLTPEEYDFFVETLEEWTEKYDLDEPNQLLLASALRNFIKQCRKEAIELGENNFLDKGVLLDPESKFMKYLDMLGLTRKFNLTLKKEEQKAQDLATLLSELVKDK